MIQYAHLLEEQYVLLNKEIPMRRYDEELLRTLHEYIIEYQKLNGSSPTYRKIAKTFYPQENGTIILHPENEHYKDIIVEECLIQGVVVGCMKRYR